LTTLMTTMSSCSNSLRYVRVSPFISKLSSFHFPNPLLHSFFPISQFPNPTFLHSFFFSSSTQFNYADSISLFNHLLHKNPTPPAIDFGRILGSIVKTKHYNIAVSLAQQMEFRNIKPDLVTCNLAHI
jgi:hypothetical protein